jgi:hypothetical protein
LIGFFPFFTHFFPVSSLNVFLVFSPLSMGFSIYFEKNTCYLELLFSSFVQFSFFMKIFTFKLNISNKCFFMLYCNFFWKRGQSQLQVSWVTNQPVGFSIVLNNVFWFWFFSLSQIESLLSWFLFLFWILLWSCGLRNF